MNNKFISTTKKASSIFLAIVLVTGTIALASSQTSFMVGVNAQAQPYYGGEGLDNRYDDRKSYGMDSYGSSNYGNDNSYGYEQPQYQQPSYKPDYNEPQYPSYGKDNNRDKIQKNIKNVDINKIKCINNNININGNNTGDVNVGNKGKVGAEGEGYSGAYSSDSGSGYGSGDGYDNKKDGFDCIINNNNTNTNIGGGGNQTIPPDGDGERTTLTVTKTVECFEENGNNDVANGITTCDELEAEITAADFNIEVTGNNPVPDEFAGSAAGTDVAIGPGGYTVEETPNAEVAGLIAPGSGITLEITFSGDCDAAGSGTIVANTPETCNIINTFTIEDDDDERTTLTVTKEIRCVDEDDDDLAPSIQQLNEIDDCDDLLEEIVPSNFTIQVTDTNPVPPTFPGSETGTVVTIGVGPYTVTETPSAELAAFLASNDDITLNTTFGGDCAPSGTGTIEDPPTPETCNIINTFTIEDDDDDDFTGSPSTIAQATGDSPELTASEKMTKLKQQWLDLLP